MKKVVLLDEKLHKKLRRNAFDKDTSMKEIVNDLVENYLEDETKHENTKTREE